jgi:hypothetical protein
VRRRWVGQGRAGEQEAAGRDSLVDCAADKVPDLRKALPLVNENRGFPLQQARRVGLRDSELSRVIEAMHCLRPLLSGPGLADAFGAFEGDGWQASDELIELVVDDASLVGRSRDTALPYQNGRLNQSFPAG